MKFYLGTHKPHWLKLSDDLLFVSDRTLKLKAKPIKAVCNWALDSGGFSELSMYGKWKTTEAEYVDRVKRYMTFGKLDWCAPQDWMCEPNIIESTGLSIKEHQHRTVKSYLSMSKQQVPVIPVLQGWEIDDYLECIQMYEDAGVDLDGTVGIGSVCRRQSTKDIAKVLKEVSLDGKLKLHGFGVKKSGLKTASEYLYSADSMAWSYGARYQEPMKGHSHKHCNNCREYAEIWRKEVLETI